MARKKKACLRSPIRYFGGKGRMVSKLLPLVPPHRTYVEVFGGGASLLFSKEPSPVEVYNDIDSGLVNLFRVLRDKVLFREFKWLASLTPYSREEYLASRALLRSGRAFNNEVPRCDVGAAWRYFLLARQGVAGHPSRAGWSFSVLSSSRGMSRCVSSYLAAIELLPQVHERLRRMQIECGDWRKILSTYDTPDTFFYLDPPYVHESRGEARYLHELTDDDHRELIERIVTLRGKVLISGYDNRHYRTLRRYGWRTFSWHVFCGSGARRMEKVWLNYPAPKGARWGNGVTLTLPSPSCRGTSFGRGNRQ